MKIEELIVLDSYCRTAYDRTRQVNQVTLLSIQLQRRYENVAAP